MSSYRLAGKAIDDLEQITFSIAEQSGWDAAMDTEAKLFLYFDILAAFPGIGHRRPDLTSKPLCFSTLDPYLIAYQRESSPIIIHRILHGARDVKRILRSRPS